MELTWQKVLYPVNREQQRKWITVAFGTYRVCYYEECAMEKISYAGSLLTIAPEITYIISETLISPVYLCFTDNSHLL